MTPAYLQQNRVTINQHEQICINESWPNFTLTIKTFHKISQQQCLKINDKVKKKNI